MKSDRHADRHDERAAEAPVHYSHPMSAFVGDGVAVPLFGIPLVERLLDLHESGGTR